MAKKSDSLFKRMIKGLIVGASMLIPGASGGTMAIILGIYDDLIHAVSTLRKNVKSNVLLLGPFTVAVVAGIVLFSGPMLSAVTMWNKPMMFLFMGAIIGSIPPLYKKVAVSKIKPVNMVVASFGMVIGITTMFLPEGILKVGVGFNLINFLIIAFAGIIIAVALVLPGISASYILLMMGIYDMTLNALREIDLLFLTPLAVGILSGTFLTAGILEKAMKKHPQFTYMLIIGFMLGSLFEVFPGLPGSDEIVFCVLTFAAGISAILWIGGYNNADK